MNNGEKIEKLFIRSFHKMKIPEDMHILLLNYIKDVYKIDWILNEKEIMLIYNSIGFQYKSFRIQLDEVVDHIDNKIIYIFNMIKKGKK